MSTSGNKSGKTKGGSWSKGTSHSHPHRHKGPILTPKLGAIITFIVLVAVVLIIKRLPKPIDDARPTSRPARQMPATQPAEDPLMAEGGRLLSPIHPPVLNRPPRPTSLPATHYGQWVDLLEKRTPADETYGQWTPQGKALHAKVRPAENAPNVRIALPAQPTDSYEVEVTVSAKEGLCETSIILPIQEDVIRAVLSDASGRSGIDVIDGGSYDTNLTTRRYSLSAGQKHTLRATVRFLRDDYVSVVVNNVLTREKILEYLGIEEKMSLSSDWRFKTPGVVGVGIGPQDVTFHAIRYRTIREPADATSQPATAPAQ